MRNALILLVVVALATVMRKRAQLLGETVSVPPASSETVLLPGDTGG